MLDTRLTQVITSSFSQPSLMAMANRGQNQIPHMLKEHCWLPHIQVVKSNYQISNLLNDVRTYICKKTWLRQATKTKTLKVVESVSQVYIFLQRAFADCYVT